MTTAVPEHLVEVAQIIAEALASATPQPPES